MSVEPVELNRAQVSALYALRLAGSAFVVVSVEGRILVGDVDTDRVWVIDEHGTSTKVAA